jgi:hypothetical protein
MAEIWLLFTKELLGGHKNLKVCFYACNMNFQRFRMGNGNGKGKLSQCGTKKLSHFSAPPLLLFFFHFPHPSFLWKAAGVKTSAVLLPKERSVRCLDAGGLEQTMSRGKWKRPPKQSIPAV